MYNCVKKTDYEVSGYLDGLNVVKMDYRKLFDRYRGNGNVLFVVDPPYLSTDVSTYSAAKYWRLKEYLDVLNILKEDHYVFFTSDKTSLTELFDLLEANYRARNPFNSAKVCKCKNTVSYNGRYTDLMYYKNAKKK
jgi:predicted methyltransferase